MALQRQPYWWGICNSWTTGSRWRRSRRQRRDLGQLSRRLAGRRNGGPPNGLGISLRSSEPGNAAIGGAERAKRNLISGNTGAGISAINGSTLDIEGNLVGNRRYGAVRPPERYQRQRTGECGGTVMRSGSTIGGCASSGGNFISGNALNGIGIHFWRRPAKEQLRGTHIGVAADGQTPLPERTATVSYRKTPRILPSAAPSSSAKRNTTLLQHVGRCLASGCVGWRR